MRITKWSDEDIKKIISMLITGKIFKDVVNEFKLQDDNFNRDFKNNADKFKNVVWVNHDNNYKIMKKYINKRRGDKNMMQLEFDNGEHITLRATSLIGVFRGTYYETSFNIKNLGWRVIFMPTKYYTILKELLHKDIQAIYKIKKEANDYCYMIQYIKTDKIINTILKKEDKRNLILDLLEEK